MLNSVQNEGIETVSGAYLKNYSRFFHETWYVVRASGGGVPFAILVILTFSIFLVSMVTCKLRVGALPTFALLRQLY